MNTQEYVQFQARFTAFEDRLDKLAQDVQRALDHVYRGTDQGVLTQVEELKDRIKHLAGLVKNVEAKVSR